MKSHRRSLQHCLLVRRRRDSRSLAATEADSTAEAGYTPGRQSAGPSSNSTEPSHSANQLPSNHQATPPGRDPIVANLPSPSSHGPPLPLSVDPQTDVLPETESGEQQTQGTSTSQKMWNCAYDSLKEDSSTVSLVESYVRTLRRVLGTGNDTDAGDVVGLDDPDTRQGVLKKLVEAGQTKIATSSRVARGVGNVVEFIQGVKLIIDAAIGNIPQAALPWAGVCVGLQVWKIVATTCSS